MISDTNTELYDRQIRLFGFETQKKILRFKVEIYSNGNELISGEIAKNFILLGSTCILDENSRNSLIKVWEDYNEENKNEGDALKICVDRKDLEADYYICSKCLSYDNKICNICLSGNDNTRMDINNDKDSINTIVQQLLLGGIFVQEMVKKINNEEYKSKYILEYK
ncbi:hypothetical protein SLOPH_1834 [Spraguea lophii 42_110]|uniref:Uncharacterized protein n=1 Tax=Spraguea lophii (strain 42_110) TaxID=1358809 RepID=S7W6V2_SPRLO|nr:hypothetical protein SLOPH_1834 [Spraguea lophii 42_110]